MGAATWPSTNGGPVPVTPAGACGAAVPVGLAIWSVSVARVGVAGADDGRVGPAVGWAAAGCTVGAVVGGAGVATCDGEPGAHATPTVASTAHCSNMNRIRMFMAVCACKAACVGNADYGRARLATLRSVHGGL
jgi:hypothetical protein